MPWLQTTIVVLILAGCVAYLVRAARKTLNAKCGESGSCCSRRPTKAARPLAHDRVAFLPVEMLSRKK